MKKLPRKLQLKLNDRSAKNALRTLPVQKDRVDFSSNDYLGFASSEAVFEETTRILAQNGIRQNGSTGSRLLSGNHPLYAEAERCIAAFHASEAALIFNSGYDANIGF
ncbi:MAG: aminotransferase class I/II-fold pyridoxal phosphate-dependent enzyme, partial [Sinomicrobium sp.]|nr:aminotransferase class I/II-fold pyridoxal phosphate-dependent enzyme [Sinomicrobium sp.]